MSSYIHIASQTLGSNQASVTFSSIPTTLNGKTFRDLVLVINARQTSGTGQNQIRLNSDTAGNYANLTMEGRATTFESVSSSGNAWWYLNFNNGDLDSNFGATIVTFFDYAQTNKQKVAISRGNNMATGSTSVGAGTHRWASNSAVNTILVQASATYAAGSTFSLYGIEG